MKRFGDDVAELVDDIQRPREELAQPIRRHARYH
jgi:hypothetical protein